MDLGQDAVDVINWELNASPEERAMGREEEWWLCELGERPAMHVMFTVVTPYFQHIMAMASRDYWIREKIKEWMNKGVS
jgi:hypothetical protein